MPTEFTLSFFGVYQNAYERQLANGCNPSGLNDSSGLCCGSAAYDIARNRTEYQAFTLESASNDSAAMTIILVADSVEIAHVVSDITAAPVIRSIAPYINISIDMIAPMLDGKEPFADFALFRPSGEQSNPGEHLM